MLELKKKRWEMNEWEGERREGMVWELMKGKE